MKLGGDNNDWWVHTAVISSKDGDEKIENQTSLFWRGSLSGLMKRMKILGGRRLSNVERIFLKNHRHFTWVDPSNGNRMEMRILDKAPAGIDPSVAKAMEATA